MFAATRLLRCGQIASVLLVCLLTCVCQSKVSKENFAKIKTGMTLSEVETILGPGTEEGGDGSGVAAQVGVDVGGGKVAPSHVWRSGDKEIRVYLQNGKVATMVSKGL